MAKKNNEYRMAIKIAGEIEKSLYNSTDLTRKELDKIARKAAGASSQSKGLMGDIKKGLKDTEPFFNGVEKAGEKAFQAVAAAATAAGTAIIGVGTASANVGIDFESAFAGVKKTTTATEQEYAKMKQEILAMTREIPAVGTEISAVAESAGQLGIEKENLLDFTRTIIDLGESTNLVGEEGASMLAKFANITNMDPGNYRRLGSVIVDLGNNFATTEADIVSMATKMASAGELANFTEPQIMAMAAAMSSVGIEEEAGGSSMSKLIKKVQVAVETGSKDLKEYASVAGMSVEEFREAFQKDGLSAISAFISGLNDVERNGKSATVILDDMGLTEIRLSNTILSLANANEMMMKAVETANKAWGENNALTNEAAMRYETTESKLAILGNGFTEMGIEIYDQFNGPLREGIDIVTDLVHAVTDDIRGSNAIHDIAQDIVENIPTAVRVTGELVEAVGELAGPFLSIGGWLVDNPSLLEGTIAGVGTALATYKVASGISGLVTSMAALGPAGWAVLGAGGAVAAITGIGVAVKKTAAEAKKANLDGHFGSISLSMAELEEVAAHIIDNGSLGQLQESINALGELEGISDSISDTVSDIDRMNWKVSIGMELTEEEQELYQQRISSYVSEVQEYVEQEQYAVNLAVGVLTGDDLENSNIVSQLNTFYSGKSAELARLGSELNRVVTAAFNDGLLDIPEAEKISELQKQIADIKAGLAMGNYEASLDLLGMKYANQDIDADTFLNLQEELAEQAEVARANYDDAYVAYNQAQRAMLKEGPENGGITQEEYDANMEAAEKGYRDQVGELEAKAVAFQAQLIMDRYGEEIGEVMPDIDAGIKEVAGNYGQIAYEADNPETALLSGVRRIWADLMDFGLITEGMGIEEMDRETRGALGEPWGKLAPQVEALEKIRNQYIAEGEEVPAYINEGIKNANAIGILSGDTGAVRSAVGQAITEDEELASIFNNLEGKDMLPVNIKEAMDVQKKEVDEAVRELCEYTKEKLDEEFSGGIDVDTAIMFKMRSGTPLVGSGMDAATIFKTMSGTPVPAKIGQRAKGGIVTKPEISWIGEAGYDESVIPIDGSQDAINLWKHTGELLGVSGKGSSFSSLAREITGEKGSSGSWVPDIRQSNAEDNKFVFAPVINAGGSSLDEERLRSVISGMFEEFEDRIREVMEKRERDRERFSFS